MYRHGCMASPVDNLNDGSGDGRGVGASEERLADLLARTTAVVLLHGTVLVDGDAGGDRTGLRMGGRGRK